MTDLAIPVTVVAGFLGAGKTTLVNRWLGELPRGEVAVIVNEHGAVGIDGELLAERAQELVEIAGGCVCCTSQAELVAALDRISRGPQPPQRVLVETSGAASPAGVLRAIASGGLHGAFRLDGVVTVVDATRLAVLGEHDLAREQLGYADVVVLSRADLAPRTAHESLAAWNGAASFAYAAHGAVVEPAVASLTALLALRDAAPTPAPSVPAAAHVYESISLVHDGDLDGERFADFVETELAAVAGRIFRTKGILAVAGVAERMIVQGVADAVEITFGAPWADSPRRSRFVVVGFGLERAALERAFAACAGR